MGTFNLESTQSKVGITFVVILIAIITGVYFPFGLGILGVLATALLIMRTDIALRVIIFIFTLGLILPPVILSFGFFSVALTWANIVGLVFFASTFRYLHIQKIPIRWHPSLTAMLLLIILSMVSLIWAKDMRDGVIRAIAWGFLFLFYFAFSQILRERKMQDAAMQSLATAGWVIIVLGLFSIPLSSARLDVLGINPNGFSSRLIVALLGIFWMPRKEEFAAKSVIKPHRILYLFLAVILITFSASRGESIALATFIMLIFFRRESRPQAIVVTFLLAFLVVSSSLDLFNPLVTRFTSDSDLGGRVDLWQISWQLIQQNPWIGLGVGQTQAAIGFALGLDVGKSPHNPLLLVTLDLGIIGLILYTAFIMLPIWAYIKSIRQYWTSLGEHIKFNYWLLLVTLVAYLISWFKSGGGQHAIALYLLLAMLIVMNEQLQPSTG